MEVLLSSIRNILNINLKLINCINRFYYNNQSYLLIYFSIMNECMQNILKFFYLKLGCGMN